jgi:hypothetical protein
MGGKFLAIYSKNNLPSKDILGNFSKFRLDVKPNIMQSSYMSLFMNLLLDFFGYLFFF